MAALTVTISDGLNIFGPRPTNKWGDMLWGEKWADGNEDLKTNVFKVLTQSLSCSDNIVLLIRRVVSDSLSASDILNNVNLRDSEGYYYNYTLPTNNAEDSASTDYTVSSEPSTTWTESSEPSTSWS